VSLCVLCGIFIALKLFLNMKNIFFLIILFFVGCNNSTENNTTNNAQENITATNNSGETLFKANCASCHKLAENYVGPALEGVVSRWESKELLYDFIRNSQEVISRNTYAKLLFEKYKQSPMMPFPQLKDEDITDILNYCGDNTGKVIASASK
jgi:cytochrome c2